MFLIALSLAHIYTEKYVFLYYQHNSELFAIILTVCGLIEAHDDCTSSYTLIFLIVIQGGIKVQGGSMQKKLIKVQRLLIIQGGKIYQIPNKVHGFDNSTDYTGQLRQF